MARNDLDRAIADYSEAIRLNPNDGEAYAKRGAAYERKKDSRRAADDLAKARQLGYVHPKPRRNRAAGIPPAKPAAVAPSARPRRPGRSKRAKQAPGKDRPAESPAKRPGCLEPPGDPAGPPESLQPGQAARNPARDRRFPESPPRASGARAEKPLPHDIPALASCPPGHTEIVWSAVFSPDGQRVLLGRAKFDARLRQEAPVERRRGRALGPRGRQEAAHAGRTRDGTSRPWPSVPTAGSC